MGGWIKGMETIDVKGEGKRFLHGDLICTYTLSEYISDIYVDGLCIISVKINFEKSRFWTSFTYLLQIKRDDVTGWKHLSKQTIGLRCVEYGQ